MPIARSGSRRIAVVGPCAAGKSTVIAALREAGYDARQVAQEHSFVPDMWRRVQPTDVLLYLDADYEAIMRRRPHFNFKPADLAEQARRLDHARRHCDLYLDTSELGVSEVCRQAMLFLNQLDRGQSSGQRALNG
jgi:chloramphenicol 3-O-phosphotransferase